VALAENLYRPQSVGEYVIAHVGYLFGVVSFVLGLMAKRSGVQAPQYNLHFGGRGSQYLDWLSVLGKKAAPELTAHLFRAGFGNSDAKVELTTSGSEAKHEVGRGLLHGADKIVAEGSDLPDRETFLGEEGYSQGPPTWDAPLTSRSLSTLAAPETLTDAHLALLRRFVSAFVEHPVSEPLARALGLDLGRIDSRFQGQVQTALFGPGSAWLESRRSGGGAANRLIEPFFVVEAKVLLAHVTGNEKLFPD
jgi:hypothetical protein